MQGTALDIWQVGLLAFVPSGFGIRGEDQVVEPFDLDRAGLRMPSPVLEEKVDSGFAYRVGIAEVVRGLLCAGQGDLVDVHLGDVVGLAK